jgi:uncharacterized lipoprotein
MTKSVAVLCLAGVFTLLGGCKALHGGNSCHKTQPYMAATSVPPLKIPEGLDAPDTAGSLKLPALNEPAPPRRGPRDPCLDEPPPFKVPKPSPVPQA